MSGSSGMNNHGGAGGKFVPPYLKPAQNVHTPVTYTIAGIKVDFPAKAYPSQLAMMNKVIQGLKHKQNCLLESPTGSGKSLALLCASLAWQRHEAERIRKYNEEIDRRQSVLQEAQQKELYDQLMAKRQQAKNLAQSQQQQQSLSGVVKSELPTQPLSIHELPTQKFMAGFISDPNSFCSDNNTATDESMSFGDGQGEDGLMTDDDDFQPRPPKKSFLSLLSSKAKTKHPNGITQTDEKSETPKKIKLNGSIPGHNSSEIKNFEDDLMTDDDDDDFLPSKKPFGPLKSVNQKDKPKENKVVDPTDVKPTKLSKSESAEPVPGSNPSDVKLIRPKIFFGTRTHKQIAQITRELRKTCYKSCQSVILGSREHTCINPLVKAVPNKNEACKELLDQTLFNGDRGCQWYNQSKKYGNFVTMRNHNVPDAYDLEDLVEYGKKVRACPYFATKFMMPYADIIFCPYNYLVDPNIRRTMSIELENQIVIFDEAHNMEDASREASSFSIAQDELHSALQDFERVAKKAEAEKDAYQHLATFLSRLSGWMSSNENQLAKIGYDMSGKHWTGIDFVAELHVSGFTEEYVKFNMEHFMNIQNRRETDGREARERMNFLDAKSEPSLTAISVSVTENVFRIFQYLNAKNGSQRDDFRVAILKNIVRRRRDKGSGLTTKDVLTLNLWCLNPAVAFTAIHEVVHCIVLTSGTLSPMQSFQSELGTLFPIRLEASHVIDRNQVFAGVLSVGPNNISLNGSYQNVETFSYQDELGELVLQVCQTMPHGILCFFPSYRLLENVAARWQSTGTFGKLLKHKCVITEPRTGAQDFQDAIDEFYVSISDPIGERTGALFLAVCRGKVSEGLDFADNNARAVICVGIPFPAYMDLQVQLKRDYNQKYSASRGLLKGGEWYEIQAFRALNQALGRCIRHKQDWGAILMVDDRFIQTPRYIQSLSKWVRSSIVSYTSCKTMFNNLSLFRDEMMTRPVEETSFINQISSLSNFEDGSENSFSTTAVSGENSNSKSTEQSLHSGSNDDNSCSSSNDSSRIVTPKSEHMGVKQRQKGSPGVNIADYFIQLPKRAKTDTGHFKK